MYRDIIHRLISCADAAAEKYRIIPYRMRIPPRRCRCRITVRCRYPNFIEARSPEASRRPLESFALFANDRVICEMSESPMEFIVDSWTIFQLDTRERVLRLQLRGPSSCRSPDRAAGEKDGKKLGGGRNRVPRVAISETSSLAAARD